MRQNQHWVYVYQFYVSPYHDTKSAAVPIGWGAAEQSNKWKGRVVSINGGAGEREFDQYLTRLW